MSTFVSSPIRYPDLGSPELMTRRGWWLVAMNFLLPGSAQSLAGSRKLARIGLTATLTMWALVLLALLSLLLWPQLVVGIATNFFGLLLIQVILIAYAVLWVVLTFDTLRLVRFVKARPKARPAIAVLSVVLMVVASGGALYASYLTGVTRGAIEAIFGDGGPSVPPSDGYYNILLLGADSGDGRDSMRFDSISVVSVNAETGAATITGIPRDIAHTPFAPGPMQERYPNGHESHSNVNCGWGSGINQLVTEVEVCGDGDAMYPDARANGSTPGIEATKDAAEGMLGITIPYYVLIDMHGFAALVDSLGGVTINVTERLPMGGPQYPTQPVDEWAIGWIEVGEQHMNGDTAQWYARSRYTTNDWDRMKRQRELQEAILTQFNPTNVLARFQDVAAAGTDLVKTDLPQSMLGYFVDLAVKSRAIPVQTIELTPEGGVDPENPDFAYIQQIVQTALHPPVPTESPAP